MSASAPGKQARQAPGALFARFSNPPSFSQTSTKRTTAPHPDRRLSSSASSPLPPFPSTSFTVLEQRCVESVEPLKRIACRTLVENTASPQRQPPFPPILPSFEPTRSRGHPDRIAKRLQPSLASKLTIRRRTNNAPGFRFQNDPASPPNDRDPARLPSLLLPFPRIVRSLLTDEGRSSSVR